MKSSSIFRLLIVPGLLAGAYLGLAMQDSPEPVVSKTAATFPVSGTTTVDGVEYYQLTSTRHPDCGMPGPIVCEISTSATPDGNNRVPKSSATPTDWRP